MHPASRPFAIRFSPSLRAREPRLEVQALLRTAKCPEPLCRPLALPLTAASPARCQKALPFLHRSYRLMRQTKTLPSPRFVGLCERSLQVVASPCWELALPDVISIVCVKALGPIPRRVLPVHLPVSSRKTSASPYLGEVRHAKPPLHCNFSQGKQLSRLQSFANVQAPSLARPPDCTYRRPRPGQLGLIHHAGPTMLPIAGSDITTCPNRVTGTAGLPPARLWPCRPLPVGIELWRARP
jgi:hypothetical protein